MLYLDTTDSTNNYAMSLIDADKAQHGTTVVTANQTGGKGQRGRNWVDIPGQSLLMSIITVPGYGLDAQFLFSSTVATAIAGALRALDPDWQVAVKWPNDIIINDKKAGGVLIENVLRGTRWLYAVIGFGLNVLQEGFDPSLPYATSLRIASGKAFALPDIRQLMREAILSALEAPQPAEAVMAQYNDDLFRRGRIHTLIRKGVEYPVLIEEVLADGRLCVRDSSGLPEYYAHGEVEWKWS